MIGGPLAPVVAITPGDGRDLGPWLAALGAAGLGTVVLREPALGAADYEALAREAVRHVPQVILHARNPAAAALAGRMSLGLHLPATVSLDASRVFGVSCHDRRDLDAAFARGAAWAFLSPVRSPSSKPDDREPLGVERFLAAASGRPVWALGGITPDRADLLRARGAAGVAVIGALFGVASPQAAADELRAFRWSSVA